MLEKMKWNVPMIFDECYPKIPIVHRWVSIASELRRAQQKQQQKVIWLYVDYADCVVYIYCVRIWFFLFSVLDCLNRTTIVHILSTKSVACISFHKLTRTREQRPKLYADAAMSRHVLCARIQTFYISFDFGIACVWNRNNNDRSTTKNILGNSSTSLATGNYGSTEKGKCREWEWKTEHQYYGRMVDMWIYLRYVT